MAFTEFYCNAASGSNINAGDLAANGAVTSTNGDWGNAAANRFTAASGTPFSGVSVGDFASVYLDGATLAVYIGRVTAVNAGGSSLDISSTAKSGTAPATGATGRTCTTGGAWKGPNGSTKFPFDFLTNTLVNANGDTARVNMKNGTTYSVTAEVLHSLAGPIVIQGYTTSPGDGGKWTIDGGTSGASFRLLNMSGTKMSVRDVVGQNNGATGSATGIRISGVGSEGLRIVVTAVRGNGIELASANSRIESCEAFACNQSNTNLASGINLVGTALRCLSHNNTGSNNRGFVIDGSGATLINCIADSNANDGIFAESSYVMLVNCVCYGNGGDGLEINTGGAIVENCIFESNSAYGVNNAGGVASAFRLQSNAFYSNTSGQTTGLNASLISGSITLTGSAFTDAANGNFGLNNTASDGAACHNAGIGTFTQDSGSYSATTVGYPDIGAAQHQEAGGSAGAVLRPVGMNGGLS